MKQKKRSKKEKKEKKKKSKEKKQKKQRRDTSSSSSGNSTDSEENVWVEKKLPTPVKESLPETGETAPVKREEWMSLNSLFPCVSNMSNEEKQKSNKNKESSILDQPGQSSKELNPYWKNGGTGLPQTESVQTNTVQTMDVNWLKKSLKRAKEQAEIEDRTLEEVAAERWGSLETIENMIETAERASKSKYSSRSDRSRMSNYRRRSRSKDRYDSRRSDSHSHSKRSKRRSRSNSRSRSRSKERHREYFKDDEYLKDRQRKQMYKKPMDEEDYSYSSQARKSQGSGPKKWQKSSGQERNAGDECKMELEPKRETEDCRMEDDSIEETKNEQGKVVTEADLNKLGAKIVKAEIMGDTELAKQLKIQLEEARQQMKSSGTSKSNEVETVVLTRMDSKGVPRPLVPRNESRESTKKGKNVPTHVSGERVRRFFDDDKYSLEQLFQREKGRSTTEDDAAFAKVVSKNMDMSDMFEEQIARTQSETKQDEKDRAQAIKEHQRYNKRLDNCQWCIDSKYMLKHMIVTMDSKICLSLPSHVSLTEGHCVLTPVQHITCQLQLDEDVWESLKAFKQALCKMFADQDKYPVFFEVYKNRHRFPHMKLECIPLPREIGELAPMYFKKALLECETEWSVNKKIIDLKEKDVRQAIPNGLAYFAVQFSNGAGYAHVIEDDKMFPSNFAEEIIGGMLDADHDTWRKPRRENFDEQREKVLKFSRAWSSYAAAIKAE